MVFLIMPDTDKLLHWKSIFNKVRADLKKVYRNPYRIQYNKLTLKEDEKGDFTLNKYIYTIDKEGELHYKTNKEYFSYSCDLDTLLEEILLPMDKYEMVCIIDRNLYNKLNRFMEKRIEVVHHTISDGTTFHFINTKITKLCEWDLVDKSVYKIEENKYAMHSLYPKQGK